MRSVMNIMFLPKQYNVRTKIRDKDREHSAEKKLTECPFFREGLRVAY